jgi:peptidoglycan/xylan/chitin deacetylase (PgdA/CDA1 family)
MKASFYIITAYDNVPLSESRWDAWRSVAGGGHEIGSHSISHPLLSTLPYEQMVQEVVGSKNEIDSRITTQKVRTFVYPSGDFNDNRVSVVKANYIAARGVHCALNSAPYDFYNIAGCTPDDASVNLQYWTAGAEEQGKWLVVYFHSLLAPGERMGIVYCGDFKTYLDFWRRGVWVGTVRERGEIPQGEGIGNPFPCLRVPRTDRSESRRFAGRAVYDHH